MYFPMKKSEKVLKSKIPTNSPLVLFLSGVEKDFVHEILENHISFGS